MPSSISWLDTSAEEQRRVRELIGMLAQSESRDELGIGQIRDAFSDGLFPGASTIHTRARYFLFIPWIYTLGAKTRRGAKLNAWADTQERRLIDALKDQGIGVGEGLIGRVAGASVKTLPSAIYWSALGRYGILTRDVAPEMLGPMAPALGPDDELALRATQDWHPTLPAPPSGFPAEVEGGMALRPEEATWLKERILETVPGTLLAHLLTTEAPLSPEGTPPWFDHACLAAEGPPATLLQHGRHFSLALEGAALLYNLLIAEKYEAAGHNVQNQPVASFREEIRDWAQDCQNDAALLRAWDRDEMWDVVRSLNPRIGIQTRSFVDAWLDAVISGRAVGAVNDTELRALVENRERRQKGTQSRLVNERLLRTWSGASGTSRPVYRWGTVRRITADIREGADGAGA